jgi:hypothetical protein
MMGIFCQVSSKDDFEGQGGLSASRTLSGRNSIKDTFPFHPCQNNVAANHELVLKVWAAMSQNLQIMPAVDVREPARCQYS